ncbi:hypothetical protein SAMN05428995_104304 [Loktanella sp. DSM 29012]|uniref:MSMEG_1061 family FMN-dependent PPOX-type flavoprotein n=1 Tax=Loktanella sp. DSM 29012 TaxID=1881056 RepID=UPI0008C200F5|nr:MSMEG_1061 family FMN-dependent PPOX-type flavoprotein [Loktanella sp. DSM 29012]SEQ45062.1 hypothetical protein SAMN05428995_104304 [Loktanella sp. DSM 29012]
MTPVSSVDELAAIYGPAVPRSLTKVRDRLTPAYRTWINAARFVVVSTVGPEGTDGSPRGDVGPVVRIADDRRLLLPDWMGNNRIDTLRNIVRDPRVSLMFMVPGSNNVVRVNGHAIVTVDSDVTQQFEQRGKHPRSVVVITVTEVYFQCAKAIMRSALWSGEDHGAALPKAGDLLQEVEPDFDGAAYDAGYAAAAEAKMW